MYARQEPVYFKLPSALKQDFDTLCQVDGYTKTIFLTNYIHEKVEQRRETNPKLFKSNTKKKTRTDERAIENWRRELTKF